MKSVARASRHPNVMACVLLGVLALIF